MKRSTAISHLWRAASAVGDMLDALDVLARD